MLNEEELVTFDELTAGAVVLSVTVPISVLRPPVDQHWPVFSSRG